MIILGIETSCDETSAAILEQKEGRIQILSNVVASSASLQAKYGGIIPEQAAREQLASMIPVLKESLQVAGCRLQDIDAIAVTQGPGLIGSLLVGVETAKVLAKVWEKPLIPVNHLLGHFYANWIDTSSLRDHKVAKQSQNKREIAASLVSLAPRNDELTTPRFPCIGLLVSGGHTDLVLFRDHGKYQYLGGTRDDAAGECFDKCARLLGLPYPGGPEISKLAKKGNPSAFKLPRPMSDSKDFDFSFSGLKTAVANLLKTSEGRDIADLHSVSQAKPGVFEDQDVRLSESSEILANLCASIEAAIIDILVQKTVAAAKLYEVEQIIVAGGVAANQQLKSRLQDSLAKEIPSAKLFIPPPYLCTDNGAMIASAAFFQKPARMLLDLQANPNLSLAY